MYMEGSTDVDAIHLWQRVRDKLFILWVFATPKILIVKDAKFPPSLSHSLIYYNAMLILTYTYICRVL